VTDILSAVNTYQPFDRKLADTDPANAVIIDLSSLFGVDLSNVRRFFFLEAPFCFEPHHVFIVQPRQRHHHRPLLALRRRSRTCAAIRFLLA
jgi:hypothetical protein